MMKRLFFLLTALLTLNMGMWAQTQSVNYIDANGQQQTVTATIITNSTTTLDAGWYVVTGTDVQTGSLTCNGEVHLILADDAKLTAMGGNSQAGIQVSGEGYSLTIYGQDAQSGRLIATGGKYGSGIGGEASGSGSNITINGGTVVATGGGSAAGIGGGEDGSGSNITINGGTVTATGGNHGGAGIGGGLYGSGSNITINGGTVSANGGNYGGAGIGSGYRGIGSDITINGGRVTATGGISGVGIGGGDSGSGSNITINGGMVTATGGKYAAGIGGGEDASSSDIFMPVNYRIKADGTFIHNDGTDLADSLAGKQNIEAYPDEFLNERNAAFAAISAAVEGFSNETILAVAAAAMEDVFQAEGSGDIEASKQKALDDLQYVISIYNSGKAAALGTMGTECSGCPAVDVTKGTTTIRLYSPEKVEFRKME